MYIYFRAYMYPFLPTPRPLSDRLYKVEMVIERVYMTHSLKNGGERYRTSTCSN